MSLISLKQIEKSYGEKKILANFNLNIEQGDFIAVMGPSGSGKSTLLNIIGLLENFDSGEMIFDNKTNIKPNSRQAVKILRYQISYLFQNFALIEDETVKHNIELALKYTKKNKKERLETIEKALNYVGLESMSNKRIYQLSGGEQQRVAIARVIVKPCSIILADEPTGSLDERNRDIVLEILLDLNKQGKTIELVTHDKYVSGFCNKVVYL